MKKIAEQSSLETQTVERECQDLKENCFKLQKQLEEATQSREKLQKECVELQTVKKITRSTLLG